MKNNIKWFLIGAICVVVVIFAFVFVSDNVRLDNMTSMDKGYITNESFNGSFDYSDSMSSGVTSTDGVGNILGEKVIYTANITLKTDDYEANIGNVKNIISDNNAGIASFSERARTSSSNASYINANITVKVPQSNFKIFTEQIKECGMYVSSYSENSDDITEKYMDIESKLVSLKQQEQVLDNLLLQAKNVSEIIQINEQKTKVIQEIEYNTKMKQTYDNKVDYSTVTINIQEVESTEVSQKGIGQRIIDTIVSSIEGLKLLLISILLFMVYAIPFILVFGIFVVIIVLIVKAIKKIRKNGKKDKPE